MFFLNSNPWVSLLFVKSWIGKITAHYKVSMFLLNLKRVGRNVQ